MGYTGCKVIGSHEDTKPGLYYGKVIETILGNSDEIILALNVELELGFLDESFDGFYDGKLYRVLLGDSLVSTDDKGLGSKLGVKMGLSDIKVLITIL